MWIRLMDFPLLNHPGISGMQSTWSLWMIFIFWMCSWIQCMSSILFSILPSMFIREIKLAFTTIFEFLYGLCIRVTLASFDSVIIQFPWLWSLSAVSVVEIQLSSAVVWWDAGVISILFYLLRLALWLST